MRMERLDVTLPAGRKNECRSTMAKSRQRKYRSLAHFVDAAICLLIEQEAAAQRFTFAPSADFTGGGVSRGTK